jgi:hypothetical protein
VLRETGERAVLAVQAGRYAQCALNMVCKYIGIKNME